MNFYKYEGAGNDFIMINNLDDKITLGSHQIQSVCDRHLGIGADGVILVEKSNRADCFMNYYNADGTLAEMCGNGARCTTKFFLKQTNKNLKELNIDTRAGIKNIKINEDGTYSVNMGLPYFSSDDFPESPLDIEDFNFNFVSIGNPHAVTIIDHLDEINLEKVGPIVENNKLFPNKINVEFVKRINDNLYKVRVWERGCGETLACGTGACAVFATLDKQQKFGKEITLKFPGGNLYLSKNHEGEIILRGSANFIFKGEL